jgi:hypothetical protein
VVAVTAEQIAVMIMWTLSDKRPALSWRLSKHWEYKNSFWGNSTCEKQQRDLQAAWAYWTSVCGGHHNKPGVPAATANWGHSRSRDVDTFLQQDGVCPHTENVILGVLHVCLVAMSCQTDLQRFRGGLVLATTFSWTFWILVT